jgi:hypothetical protein
MIFNGRLHKQKENGQWGLEKWISLKEKFPLHPDQ